MFMRCYFSIALWGCHRLKLNQSNLEAAAGFWASSICTLQCTSDPSLSKRFILSAKHDSIPTARGAVGVIIPKAGI